MKMSCSLSCNDFAFVIGLSWGLFAVRSVAVAFGVLDSPPFDDFGFIWLVLYELCAGVIIYYFLRKKGWILARERLAVSWKTTAAGVLLIAVSTLAYWIAFGVGIVIGGNAQPLYVMSAS